MNSKATITISTLAIAAVALLFASGPIVGSQQAQAYVYYHGNYLYHYGHYYRHPYYHHFYYGHYYGPYYHHLYYGHYGHFYGHY
jgi:hypothetical protein